MTTILVEDVYVTEGVPEFTFVKPPNYNAILVDVRTAGKPVILEGQTGTGKTTCIRQILEDLRAGEAIYLSGRKDDDFEQILKISEGRLVGSFVIDDFHRLPEGIQARLADVAKVAAESPAGTASLKLIFIGINQIGSSLIQLVPDVAKRMGIHRIQPGRKEQIRELVETGAVKLNIEIPNIDLIFEESRGDYWLTQRLSKSICLAASVLETQAEFRKIDFNINNVREHVVAELSSAHYPVVKDFCRGTRFRPSNQPYFKLLRAIGLNGASTVDLNELANSQSDLRGSINNIKEYRLQRLLDSKDRLLNNFYYNIETKSFSIDDPALFYFLQHLDWDQLRRDCGFRDNIEIFDYDIALSFAGENRDLARHIASQLRDLDVPVFLDEQFEVNLLGQTWTKVFREIFSEKSRFVVCLLDQYHLAKIWPTFEREHFLDRINEGNVIPIFLDNTKFLGIPSDVVSIRFDFDKNNPDWKVLADSAIIEKLVEKKIT